MLSISYFTHTWLNSCLVQVHIWAPVFAAWSHAAPLKTGLTLEGTWTTAMQCQGLALQQLVFNICNVLRSTSLTGSMEKNSGNCISVLLKFVHLTSKLKCILGCSMHGELLIVLSLLCESRGNTAIPHR